jgi:hypothetical protein
MNLSFEEAAMLFDLGDFFFPGIMLIPALVAVLFRVMHIASEALIEPAYVIGSNDQLLKRDKYRC